MKDIETIIPFLREFLNDRGLKDVGISLMLTDLPLNVVNETYSETPSKDFHGAIGECYVKIYNSEQGDIQLFSKYF